MKKTKDITALSSKQAFNRALIFHIIIAIGLFVSWVSSPPISPPRGLNLKQADKIVQATVINSQQVDQAVTQIENQQKAQAAAQAAKLAAMQKAAADAVAAKQQQEAKLAQLKAQQQALQQQAAAQLAALKQQQADAAKQLAATKAATLKAQQAKLQQAAKLDLAKQMSSEETQLDKQKNQQMNDQISQYTTLILQAIGQQWIIPPNVDPTKFCILEIKLASGGVVQTVSLQKSSGDSQLDSSAIAAVYKASPLPVPADPAVFAKMQDINLKVRPQDTLTS